MNPFELTMGLISIPSVTGTEREIGEFLLSHLSSRGYRVERQDVVGDRFNVFAFAGEGRVMFCTHIDTVPPPAILIREDRALSISVFFMAKKGPTSCLRGQALPS